MLSGKHVSKFHSLNPDYIAGEARVLILNSIGCLCSKQRYLSVYTSASADSSSRARRTFGWLSSC
jgi:hypothetical protein